MPRGSMRCLHDRQGAVYPRVAVSSVVDLMGQVVLGIQPSVHAAYQAQADQLGV